MYLYVRVRLQHQFLLFINFLTELCVRAPVSLVLQCLVLEVQLKVKISTFAVCGCRSVSLFMGTNCVFF